MNDINFQIEPLETYASLAEDWMALEAKACNQVFLSWNWMSNWLGAYQPNCRVLKAVVSGDLVGIALLTEREHRRHLWLRSYCLRLHQTGDSAQDQIWIEYNGILVAKGYEQAVNERWFSYLVDTQPQCDEFVFSGLPCSQIDELNRDAKFFSQELWTAPCYGIDLQALRISQKNYLESLSRNSRYQIKRSLKLLDPHNKAQIERACNSAQAKEYFHRAGLLHLKRWGSGPAESGFANPAFVMFHERLIESGGVEDGWIDVLKICFDDGLEAYFYNLIYKERVYFYLGAAMLAASPKMKVGLSGHAMCVQYYLDRGLNYYDFMSGSERYKASLGSAAESLKSIRFMRRKPKFQIEVALRHIKQRLQPGAHSH